MRASLLVSATAAIISFTLTPLVRAFARRIGALDAPGGRKVHRLATPRLGGLAVLPAGVLALALVGPEFNTSHLPLALGVLVIFATGLCDDVRGLRPSIKLIAIGIAAAIAVAGGIRIERVTFLSHTYELRWLVVPATMAWMIGVTNAFNLIDGLDGLATGLTIVAAGSAASLLILRGEDSEAILLSALLGAAVGFLPYNFSSASIFLGDSGSLVFGFVLAATSITGWQKGATAFAIGAPLLVLALPIADVIGAIVRRVAGGHSVFAADQRHIHHWLLRFGLSQRAVVLLLYACALVLAGLAVLMAEHR